VAFLFASGESLPLTVKIGVKSSVGGALITNLDYCPWLTGSAVAHPPNHADLELFSTVNGGATVRHVVIFVDQDHPPRLLFPPHACIDSMLNGVSSGWKGNIVVLRKGAGEFIDMDPVDDFDMVYDVIKR
jgi:hypothetical protein